MKGTIINLNGELVCVFPFTNDTDFESLSHNDLESRGISSNEVGCPIAIIEERKDELHFGWCFISTEITKSQVPILRRDAGTIVSLALDNDRWAKDQMKTRTCAGCRQSPCACIPVGDEQTAMLTPDEAFCMEQAKYLGLTCNIEEQEELDGGVTSIVHCELSLDGGNGANAWLTVYSGHYSVLYYKAGDDQPYLEYTSDTEFACNVDRITGALKTVHEELDSLCLDASGCYSFVTEEEWTVKCTYCIEADSAKAARAMVESGEAELQDHMVRQFSILSIDFE